jgi:hypothetical protein
MSEEKKNAIYIQQTSVDNFSSLHLCTKSTIYFEVSEATAKKNKK